MSLVESIHNIVGTQAFRRVEHVIAGASVAYFLSYVVRKGPKRIVGDLIKSSISFVPGAQALVDKEMEKEVDSTIERVFPQDTTEIYKTIPKQGVAKEVILAQLEELRQSNSDPYGGRLFAYAYSTEDPEFKAFQLKAFSMWANTNGLNAIAFPSLRKFENEVVSMTTGMLHGGSGAVGTMTSGGTESILMAVKAYREFAKETRGVDQPEIVMPVSAHPAFAKACQYFQVKPIWYFASR